jgi:hypothetical protein
MQRIRLDSAVLQSAGHLNHRDLLELEFRDGSVYHYYPVPEQIFQELLDAESAGAYFNVHIRHRFGYAQIPRAALTDPLLDFTSPKTPR